MCTSLPCCHRSSPHARLTPAPRRMPAPPLLPPRSQSCPHLALTQPPAPTPAGLATVFKQDGERWRVKRDDEGLKGFADEAYGECFPEYAAAGDVVGSDDEDVAVMDDGTKGKSRWGWGAGVVVVCLWRPLVLGLHVCVCDSVALMVGLAGCAQQQADRPACARLRAG